jgi:hypothetical protein
VHVLIHRIDGDPQECAVGDLDGRPSDPFGHTPLCVKMFREVFDLLCQFCTKSLLFGHDRVLVEMVVDRKFKEDAQEDSASIREILDIKSA